MLARCVRQRFHAALQRALWLARPGTNALLRLRAAASEVFNQLLGNERSAELASLGLSAKGDDMDAFWQCQSKVWVAGKFGSAALRPAEEVFAYDLRDSLQPMGWVLLWHRVCALCGAAVASGVSQDGGCAASALPEKVAASLPAAALAGGARGVLNNYQRLRLEPVVEPESGRLEYYLLEVC